MKTNCIFVSSMLAVLVIAAPVSASLQTIFMDDFERATNNVIGNGWDEVEDEANDASIFNNGTNGFMILRDNTPNAIATQTGMTLSTVGLTDITLMYDWGRFGTNNPGGGDTLFVEWRPDASASWNVLANHSLPSGGQFTAASIGLGAAAENLADIQIRFRGNMNDDAGLDGAKVDNVKLTGLAPDAVVPEPRTMLVWSLLASLGVAFSFVRSRGNTSAS